jgi:hypothetical protein
MDYPSGNGQPSDALASTVQELSRDQIELTNDLCQVGKPFADRPARGDGGWGLPRGFPLWPGRQWVGSGLLGLSAMARPTYAAWTIALPVMVPVHINESPVEKPCVKGDAHAMSCCAASRSALVIVISLC